MAIATAKLKEPVVQPLESVTLTLNEDEVKTLIAILNRIGGSPWHSPRMHADSINHALHDALQSVNVEVDRSNIKVDEASSRPGSMFMSDY